MKIYYLSAIISLMVLLSCSKRTLKLFFDGTEKNTQSESLVSETESLTIFSPDTSDSTNQVNANMHPSVISVHPAYRNKLCEKCHDVNHSYRLINRQPDICFTCHQPFEEKYDVVHGPVAAGFCTTCHQTHQSENKKLLTLPVREVCQYCHQPGDVEKNKAHQKVRTDDCMICHNAHGGKTSNLLK